MEYVRKGAPKKVVKRMAEEVRILKSLLDQVERGGGGPNPLGLNGQRRFRAFSKVLEKVLIEAYEV